MVRTVRKRNSLGAAQVTEFGAALFLLFSCIVLPLLNMAIIPVRFGMAKSIINNQVRKLAKSESFGEALKTNQIEAAKWESIQAIGGIVVKDCQLKMVVESTRSKKSESFYAPKSIPASWLPEGSEGPCVYLLDLRVDAEISPLVTFAVANKHIPGLTGPIPFKFREVAAWENLSRDPVTGEFFVNQ